ncbi:hypothetical protein [Kitasatospora sp. CB02891]|uniref:hypothetical protein n=1 Tax=Kitasatospora sp. CB02891 TaxID=2020329 RepID=UPI0012FE70D7|nr:hypothetical protein [Kitasatospora sp. CB02891]
MKAKKTSPPAVRVRAAQPLPAPGRWVLRDLRKMLPETGITYSPPEADQLMVLEVLPTGEILAVWMPDSTVVCTVAFAAILGVAPAVGKASPEPVVTGDPSTYTQSVNCVGVPDEPKVVAVSGLIGSFPSTDGYGTVLLLTGPDEPLVARNPSTHDQYEAMTQQVARADDGRTFRLAYYVNVPFTFRDAEVCTLSGDRCRAVDKRY